MRFLKYAIRNEKVNIIWGTTCFVICALQFDLDLDFAVCLFAGATAYLMAYWGYRLHCERERWTAHINSITNKALQLIREEQNGKRSKVEGNVAAADKAGDQDQSGRSSWVRL